VEREAVESLRAAVLEQYPARTGLTPRFLAIDAVAGADALDG
jgi:galactokinase